MTHEQGSPAHAGPAADEDCGGNGTKHRRGILARIRRQARRRAPARNDTVITTDDPLGLFLALEKSTRFRRDTSLGSLFHYRKISFREVAPRNSLHITIDGNRVSAHVDTISPLNCEPERPAHYSLAAVLAHNAAGAWGDLKRLLLGTHGDQRCKLECDVVWVDGDDGEVDEHDVPHVDAAPRLGGATASGVLGGDGDDAAVRLPFSAIDEAVHLLDTEAAPWSIQLEARVGSALDEDRLRAALGEALATHPMARARKRPSRRSHNTDQWDIPAAADLDPVRVLDCPDDTAIAVARAELQSLAVPLAEAPPLRLRLARHPDGDLVMLNVNHAAMDGFGALRVLRSIARAYSGDADPVPTVDLLDARQLPARIAAEAGGTTRMRRYLALAEKLRDLVVPPARLTPVGASDAAGYGFVHRSLPVEETAALRGLDHPGTVNDVLLAALHLAISAWNDEHGRHPRRIGVLVPANLRPSQWREEIVGNFSLPARLSTNARDRRDRWRALQVLTAQTQRKKATGMGTALVTLLRISPVVPLWAKQGLVMLLPVSGNRLVDTAMLSNLGEVDPPVFGTAGAAEELWFSPPARMPLGLAIGVVTVAGRLQLSFRYRHRLFDANAGARFADRYMEEVRGFIREQGQATVQERLAGRTVVPIGMSG